MHKEIINEHLTILTYQNNFPQGIKFKFLVKINDYLNCLKIKQKIKPSSQKLIWWKFDPFRFLCTMPLPGKTIYHVVDPYLHFWQDKIQAKNAHLIISSSNKYVSHYKNDKCSNVLKIAHGVSSDEFNTDQQKINSIKNTFGDFVIYVGAIASDININLMELICKANINLLIIGNSTNKSEKWEQIKLHKNLYYLGKMHAKELKNYIAAAKAGLVLYNFSSIQKEQVSRSPLKVLNYLAQKKPVITSIDSQVPILSQTGIYWAKNEKEYLSYTKQAINSNLFIDAECTDNYLNKHEYPKLINNILTNLEDQ